MFFPYIQIGIYDFIHVLIIAINKTLPFNATNYLPSEFYNKYKYKFKHSRI